MAAAQKGIRLPNKLCGKGGDRPQNRTEKPEELVCPAACPSETGALPAIEHESGETGQKTDRIKGLITNKFGTNLSDVITFLSVQYICLISACKKMFIFKHKLAIRRFRPPRHCNRILRKVTASILSALSHCFYE
jgi:hypothetical protein